MSRSGDFHLSAINEPTPAGRAPVIDLLTTTSNAWSSTSGCTRTARRPNDLSKLAGTERDWVEKAAAQRERARRDNHAFLHLGRRPPASRY